MAGHVAQNWNTVYPSLLNSYRKLKELQEQYGKAILYQRK
jgi:hypothetical protein